MTFLERAAKRFSRSMIANAVEHHKRADAAETIEEGTANRAAAFVFLGIGKAVDEALREIAE